MKICVLNTHVLYKLGFQKGPKKDEIQIWCLVDGLTDTAFHITEVPGSEKNGVLVSRHFLDHKGVQLVDIFDLWNSAGKKNHIPGDLLLKRITDLGLYLPFMYSKKKHDDGLVVSKIKEFLKKETGE